MVQNYLNITMHIKDRGRKRAFSMVSSTYRYAHSWTSWLWWVVLDCLNLLFSSVARVRLLIWLKTMCLREMLLLLLPVYKLNENDGKEHIFQTMINWLFWQISIVYCIDPIIIAMMRAFDAKNLPSKSENETRKLYRLVEMKTGYIGMEQTTKLMLNNSKCNKTSCNVL